MEYEIGHRLDIIEAKVDKATEIMVFLVEELKKAEDKVKEKKDK